MTDPTHQDANYYKLGMREAYRRRYPLYSTLIAAEHYEAAADYRKGWYEANGEDLAKWRDGKKR